MEHHKLSASGAHKWANCVGSVHAEKGYPDFNSTASTLGTIKHDLADYCLSNCVEPDEMLGENAPKHPGVTVDQEMCDQVGEYVDYLTAIGGKQEYEIRLSLYYWITGGFGTCDAIIIDGGTLYIVDLKTGRNRVSAYNNYQLMLYALGALDLYNMDYHITKVIMVIVQPSLHYIDEFEMTPIELLQWGDWLRGRAELAALPNQERTVGNVQCKWCKAKGDCAELYKFNTDTLLMDFDTLQQDSIAPTSITQLQKTLVLDSKQLILGWILAIEDEAKQKLLMGKSFDGYKLVKGRSSRKWRDSSEAEKILTKELQSSAFESKLLSVPKAIKALGKENKSKIEDLIMTSEGEPQMVRVEDPRPEHGVTPDDFD